MLTSANPVAFLTVEILVTLALLHFGQYIINHPPNCIALIMLYHDNHLLSSFLQIQNVCK